MNIEVLKPGALSTFQDLGRTGSQHLGMPVCGVMDEVSHRIANAAVGNAPELATLEITLLGPALRFDLRATIAWAGADLSPLLDGVPVPEHTPVPVQAGQTLQFGRRRRGFRAYLAVAGGYLLDPVMGSCSTYTRGAIGGHDGRALRKGDVLSLRDPEATHAAAAAGAHCLAQMTALAQQFGPFSEQESIRVLAGRECDHFEAAEVARFAASAWRIHPQSDRMGYRLEGEPLQRRIQQEILSVPIAFGTVQVPPSGLPIVLMADRQSVGGYPKIAQVATVDLPRIAQAGPGDSLRFRFVDMDEAQQALMVRSALCRAMEAASRPSEVLP